MARPSSGVASAISKASAWSSSGWHIEEPLAVDSCRMKKESRLLRVGVLGCGPICQIAHFDACRKARNAELYAICDVAEDLLAKMTAIHEPQKSYLKLEDMLADSNVEAIILGAADQFHVPLCRQVLAAGKPVL